MVYELELLTPTLLTEVDTAVVSTVSNFWMGIHCGQSAETNCFTFVTASMDSR